MPDLDFPVFDYSKTYRPGDIIVYGRFKFYLNGNGKFTPILEAGITFNDFEKLGKLNTEFIKNRADLSGRNLRTLEKL